MQYSGFLLGVRTRVLVRTYVRTYRVNCAGIQFLDVLSGVAGLANAAPVLVDGRPPRFGAVALAHRRKRAALSGVLRELTLQQGFM